MFFFLSLEVAFKTNGPVSFFLPYLEGISGFLVNIVLLQFAAIHEKKGTMYLETTTGCGFVCLLSA